MSRLAFIAEVASLGQRFPEYASMLEKIVGCALTTDDLFKPTADEISLWRDGLKIDAIKAYRFRTNASLILAKNAIEKAAGI